MEQVGEVNFRLFVSEQLPCRGSQGIDGGVGGLDALCRVGAKRSGEGGGVVTVDDQVDGRVLPPRDGRYRSRLRRP
jgi:hypothetical protein